MELMKPYAHLINIIRKTSEIIIFSWIEIIHHPPWCKIISIIVIQTQQPIPDQHLRGLKAGCLEAGMLFHHYKMSALEHHQTHWLKSKKNKFNSLLTNFLISVVCNIEHCQWTLAGKRMSYKLQIRWVWPQRTRLISRPLHLTFGKPFGQHTKRFQRVGVNGGMIKEVCVRWFLIKLQCRLVWILSDTGRQCYWE